MPFGPARALLLVLLSLGLFAAIGEPTLRWYLSRHIFYDIEMSRYANLLKIPSENEQIGHVHRPNSAARLMGVDVRINSDGLRDDETARERSGRRRWIFLGDSLTFGWGVSKAETFEQILEGALSEREPTEILNFGIGNYNTTQEYNLFVEKGLEYSPDAVVVFYFINDAEPVPSRSRFWWLAHSRLVTFYWSRVVALAARFSKPAGFEAYYTALYRDDAPGWRATRDSLLGLKRVCGERDIDLRVVLLPELHQLDPYLFEEQYRTVVEFLEAHQIPVLDLAPRFAGRDPRTLWVSSDDAHPNAVAHDLIARYSLDFIGGANASH